MVGHGIVQCSCGRTIVRCRCPGPHTPVVRDKACERCREEQEVMTRFEMERLKHCGEDLAKIAQHLSQHFPCAVREARRLLGKSDIKTSDVVIMLLNELLTLKSGGDSSQRRWVNKDEVFALSPFQFTETYY